MTINRFNTAEQANTNRPDLYIVYADTEKIDGKPSEYIRIEFLDRELAKHAYKKMLKNHPGAKWGGYTSMEYSNEYLQKLANLNVQDELYRNNHNLWSAPQ